MSQFVPYQGPGAEIRTGILGEDAKACQIINLNDMTVYDAGDMNIGVVLTKTDQSVAPGGDLSSGDKVYYIQAGEDAVVNVLGTGTIALGSRIIADQTAVGYASASTTANDISKYGIGIAVAAKDGDGLVKVRLNR